MKALAVAVIALGMSTSLAHAKHHHHYAYHGKHHRYANVKHHYAYDSGNTVAHPVGCPSHNFCGCGVSVRVFGRIVDDLMLAWNWARKFPHSAPGPGKVAVWPHHVAYIEQINGDGTATLYDPNSGRHLTRVHRRSLAGAVVVDPHGRS